MNSSPAPHLFADGKKEAWQQKLTAYEYILFFTDYDGTLASFHPDPASAYPLPEIPELLKALKARLPCSPTIITGRRPEDIRELMPDPSLPVAGLHGLLYLPEDKDRSQELPQEMPEISLEVITKMKELCEKSTKLRLEDKGILKAIHFNEEISGKKDEIKRDLENMLKDMDWEVISGHRVLEIRPENWHKGRAVKTLRRRYAARLNCNPRDCLAIYAGDDITDEDVFRNLSNPRLTVHIQNEDNMMSAADYLLSSPSEMSSFLEEVYDILYL